jgi:prolyl-tRNA editing enzyme YbaK/EbsC (Cys-tRNA(Pro) deacylase)
MSKSLKRVRAALQAANADVEILEMRAETRTAAQAAAEAGCEIDQIAKSIIFAGEKTGAFYLFVAAGGNQVDPALAGKLAGEPLTRADPNGVRAVTGFAIGGVAPVGHLTAIPCFLDRRLIEFDVIWAAAGTPRHIFSISPEELAKIIQAQPVDFAS